MVENTLYFIGIFKIVYRKKKITFRFFFEV